MINELKWLKKMRESSAVYLERGSNKEHVLLQLQLHVFEMVLLLVENAQVEGEGLMEIIPSSKVRQLYRLLGTQ